MEKRRFKFWLMEGAFKDKSITYVCMILQKQVSLTAFKDSSEGRAQ